MTEEIIAKYSNAEFRQKLLKSLNAEQMSITSNFSFKDSAGKTHSADSPSEGMLFRIFEVIGLHVVDHSPFVSQKLRIKTHFDFYVKEWNAYVEVNGTQHWQRSSNTNGLINDYVKRLYAMKNNQVVIDVDSIFIRKYPLKTLNQFRELNEKIANGEAIRSTVVTLVGSHSLLNKKHGIVKNKSKIIKSTDLDPITNTNKINARIAIGKSHEDSIYSNTELISNLLSKKGLSKQILNKFIDCKLIDIRSIEKKGHKRGIFFPRVARKGNNLNLYDYLKITSLQNNDTSIANLQLVSVNDKKGQKKNPGSVWKYPRKNIDPDNIKHIYLVRYPWDFISYMQQTGSGINTHNSVCLAIRNPKNLENNFQTILNYYSYASVERLTILDKTLVKAIAKTGFPEKIQVTEKIPNNKNNWTELLVKNNNIDTNNERVENNTVEK